MEGDVPRVCVVGSSNMDLTFRAPRLPRLGETLAGREFRQGFGGKGANQAVMAARLGAIVTVVTAVGRDPFGEQTIANYRREGVNVEHVLQDPARPTGVAAIVVDDAAHNCIIVVPGANNGLSAQEVKRAAAAVATADVVICQLEVPQEAVLEAFRLAKAAGVRTVLNPAPAAPLSEELLRLTDICVPNETELEAMTGLPAATQVEAETAARALSRRGVGAVVVTLGDRGALLVADGNVGHFPAVSVQAVDPTAAGDAFIAALAVAVVEGRALGAATRWANAVAALTVTRPGAQAAFPSRGELERFLQHARQAATPPRAGG
jgi:ribokinase